MATDGQQVATLFAFFLGVALCMWRWPRADRWHYALSAVAAVLWTGLLILDPRVRTPGFALIVGGFMTIALSAGWRARFEGR